MVSETPEPTALPEATVKRRGLFSPIWLVPIIAAMVGGWLAYKTISETGPTIQITFIEAGGVEAGKTQIKYKDIVAGVVTSVDLSDDLSTVVVTAEMVANIDPHLTEETRFWIVRPRFSASGVTGLDTLLSGAFIQMDPGGGNQATPGAQITKFDGLETPPQITSDVPGRQFILKAADLGSLNPGSPLYFRGLQVGQVLTYELDEDAQGITIEVFINDPFADLVRANSRFWNVSGITGSLSASGISVSTQSLAALISGGVAFETPPAAMNQETSPENTEFTLYESLAAMQESGFVEKETFIAFFDGSVRGLEEGAPVEFRGIRVGTVTRVAVDVDLERRIIRIPVTFNIEPQRFDRRRGDWDTHYAVDSSVWVRNGLRAQLRSGNLITGALFVDLDVYPDAPPADLTFEDGLPVIPSIPAAGFSEVTKSATAVLDKIASLPLQELVDELKTAVQTTNMLLSRPALRQAVDSLDNVGPILSGLDATVQKANAALGQAESTFRSTSQMVAKDSQLQNDLRALLRELRDAARAARVLADFLERHPEALIQGKGGR